MDGVLTAGRNPDSQLHSSMEAAPGVAGVADGSSDLVMGAEGLAEGLMLVCSCMPGVTGRA